MQSISGVGVIVPLVTPCHFPDLRRLLDHVVEGGVSAVFILGTTGENLKLNQKQRMKVIEETVKYLRNRVPLLVGIGAAKLAESLELLQVVDAIAATAVMVPHLWGGDGLSTMEELLSSSQGNFILYNHPKLTRAKSLSIEVIQGLALNERISGIKDSSGDLEYFDALLKVVRHPTFKIYYGREEHLAEVLDKNIDGIVSGCANLDPQLLSELWKTKEKGIWSQFEALRAAVNQAGDGHYVSGLKVLLKQRGWLTDAGLW